MNTFELCFLGVSGDSHRGCVPILISLSPTLKLQIKYASMSVLHTCMKLLLHGCPNAVLARDRKHPIWQALVDEPQLSISISSLVASIFHPRDIRYAICCSSIARSQPRKKRGSSAPWLASGEDSHPEAVDSPQSLAFDVITCKRPCLVIVDPESISPFR